MARVRCISPLAVLHGEGIAGAGFGLKMCVPGNAILLGGGMDLVFPSVVETRQIERGLLLAELQNEETS
jgi:hypothetical protein